MGELMAMTPEQVVPVLMGVLVVSVVIRGVVEAVQGWLWRDRLRDAQLEIYEASVARLRDIEGRLRALERREREVPR